MNYLHLRKIFSDDCILTEIQWETFKPLPFNKIFKIGRVPFNFEWLLNVFVLNTKKITSVT